MWKDYSIRALQRAIASATLLLACACTQENNEQDSVETLLTTVGLAQIAGDSPLIPNAVILDGVAAEAVGMRSLRYCEVLLIEGGPLEVRAATYNTFGQNFCPETEWDALDPAQIQFDFQALAVAMNGPRGFIVNGVRSPNGSSTQFANFGNIRMGLVAIVIVSPSLVAASQNHPYVSQSVRRTNIWLYDAGAEVYELVNPNGNVYRMQSFAQYVDASITAASLPALGDRLALPEGWSYRVRTLTAAEGVAPPDGLATVLTDEFGNTYQLTNSIIAP